MKFCDMQNLTGDLYINTLRLHQSSVSTCHFHRSEELQFVDLLAIAVGPCLVNEGVQVFGLSSVSWKKKPI